MGGNSQAFAINDLGRSVGLRVINRGVPGLTRFHGPPVVVSHLALQAPFLGLIWEIAAGLLSVPRQALSRPTEQPRACHLGENGVRLVVRHGKLAVTACVYPAEVEARVTVTPGPVVISLLAGDSKMTSRDFFFFF